MGIRRCQSQPAAQPALTRGLEALHARGTRGFVRAAEQQVYRGTQGSSVGVIIWIWVGRLRAQPA